MQALKHSYHNLGDRIWGLYGFSDTFNLGGNWVADRRRSRTVPDWEEER